MQGFSYIKDTVTLAYDPNRCVGCGRCAEVCPHDVFFIENKKVHVRDRDDCMECGACMVNCAAGAISVDAGVGCAAGLITEWLRDFAPGLVRRSSCG